jgi:cytochrome c oxidase assembly protein subunit 15
MKPFTRFAWSVLAYDVAVIAWGALVRATGSGAGCGQHWPTCNGQVVPRSPAAETVVEFTHRASSGIALVLVFALAVWARRAFPRGHPARGAAALSLLFIVTEALLGAGLVLFGWVAADASAGRGWAMALHLANTFLLLAALALTASSSSRRSGRALRSRSALPALLALGLAATVLAGVTGAIAALGDTLFPATSFGAGLRQELGGGTSLLLRLRVIHPFVAGAAGLLLVAGARRAARACPEPHVRLAALSATVLVLVELAVGAANVFLLAPVPLQVVHLVLADLIWISVVLVAGWSTPGEAHGLAEEAVAVT